MMPADVGYWHLADMQPGRPMSAFGGKADIANRAAMSAIDPKRTSASISCCSSEAGFSPYQSTRLSRYDAFVQSLGADMRRREFLSVLGGAAAAGRSPRARSSRDAGDRFPQQPVAGGIASVVAAFRQGLRETGLHRRAECVDRVPLGGGRYDRLAALAADLVEMRVTLSFCGRRPAGCARGQAATSTIPMVFSAASDPIGVGLVASLNRPGGNVTGMGIFNETLGPKRLDLLKELVPSAARGGLSGEPIQSQCIYRNGRCIRRGARAWDRVGTSFNASTEREIEAAYDEISKLRGDALVVAGEPFFDSQRDRIVATVRTTYALPRSTLGANTSWPAV